MTENAKTGISRLRADVIGPWGLAALAIGITSPAMGLYSLWAPMQVETGPISPLIFIAAMLMTLPTAISYALLNREMPSTGSAATWLWVSLNPSLGYLAGLAMVTYFFMATVAQPLMFALFFRDLLQWFGIPASGLWVLVLGILIATIPVAIVGWRGAEASIRATVVLMLVETVVVLLLAATVLGVKAETGEITLAPFNPGEALHGAEGFWAAMVLGVLAFCGFDVVSTAAEEANAPRKYLPKAIVITVIGMAVFWAFNAWAFTLGVSHEEVVEYNSQGLTAITPLAERYWGAGALIVILTAFTGIMAVTISCMQGASRLLFVLARHSLLPKPFARLSGPAGIPRRAVVFVIVATVVLDLLSVFAMRDGLKAFLFWVNGLVFFATLTFAAVNLANILLLRNLPDIRHRWLVCGVVPVFGIAVNLYLIYAGFLVNLAKGEFSTGAGMVVTCLVIFLCQVVAVWLMRRLRPALLENETPLGVPSVN